MASKRKHQKAVITLVLFVITFTVFLYLAQSMSQSEQVQQLVSSFGYIGVVIVAVIAGLNAIVPIPAATFAPVFVAAGLSIPLVIIALTIGTLIADFVGFFLGRLSRVLIEERHPKIFAFITNFRENHAKWTLLFVAVYAALAPLPNEIILIPLALTGIRFTSLIIPLLIGNFFHHLLLVYGVIGLTTLLF